MCFKKVSFDTLLPLPAIRSVISNPLRISFCFTPATFKALVAATPPLPSAVSPPVINVVGSVKIPIAN